MRATSLASRLDRLERQSKAAGPTEADFRDCPAWPVYKASLLQRLASYPQKGLHEEARQAIEDLETRPDLVTSADRWRALEDVWLRHYHEFAPDPRTAEHFALIDYFKARGLTDEDLDDFYRYARDMQARDAGKTGRCADCGTDLTQGAWHCWTQRDNGMVSLCRDCERGGYDDSSSKF